MKKTNCIQVKLYTTDTCIFAIEDIHCGFESLNIKSLIFIRSLELWTLHCVFVLVNICM